MTVPPGTPKNLEWADRMRQALQIAGAVVGEADSVLDHENIGFDWGSCREALRKLDTIADELQAFDKVTEESGLRTFLNSLKAGSSLEEAVEDAGGAIVEASVCGKCGHEQHGFETEEFSVICRFVDPNSIVDDEACQCRGM